DGQIVIGIGSETASAVNIETGETLWARAGCAAARRTPQLVVLDASRFGPNAREYDPSDQVQPWAGETGSAYSRLLAPARSLSTPAVVVIDAVAPDCDELVAVDAMTGQIVLPAWQSLEGADRAVAFYRDVIEAGRRADLDFLVDHLHPDH